MPLAAASLQLPGYVVTETLYTGTRTVVYRGQRQRDTLPVVIKLLRQEHPRFSDLVQFRYQYTLTKNLDLPTVIKSYSLEPYRNGYALVMEDFGGLSLAAYAQQNGCSVPLDLFWSIALQLTDILHALYQQHIIHKDIKPANILINPSTQQIKLIDFSIASLLPRETQASQHPSELEGTLAYLAPEQTGRMNRGVDYRSDFYALGVTFFELLTGRVPFASTDPMELVHCHLATMPPLAHTLQPAIPEMVSRLVNKLMAKNAEGRYQSALGLKHDLEYCRSQWLQGNTAPFELGTRDVCDRFLIPETLYGREPEVEALLAAFERVAGGQTAEGEIQTSPHSSPLTPDSSRSELILVAGFSGIGKTAVINEVQKPIARQRGYFIKGKYDQFQRNIPFSAFVQAFRDLIGQLLSESDAQLEQWKQKLLAALGENGQVMLEVIPELERLIGPQPLVPALTGDAAQNRFNRLFQQFIQVFTAPEHPLVIFIDDLQWADSASLQLMTLLMSAVASQHLLFIGAYRDHEVTPAHPLALSLEAIRQSNTIVHLMTLAPLDQSSISQLVADTLHCELAAAEPLAALVMSKTSGNPFFSTQFLKALHEEGQIRFNFEAGCWECDIAQVRSLALTDDVVEFMALQLQKLPADTQTVLQLAACIGNQFDLETLAIVHETAQPETAEALWKALQDGLILPQNDVYKFYQGQEFAVSGQRSAVSGQPLAVSGQRSAIQGIDSTSGAEVNDVGSRQPWAENVDVLGACTYKFLHDRVQQAAYALIPEAQRSAMHLKIGRLLLKQLNADWDDRHFAIINHLNIGSALMVDQAERESLARLNLAAYQRAKLATAYAAAVQYVDIGMNLLPPDPWQTAYALTLALHTAAAETAYLTTDFDQAERLIQTIWQRAASPLDCVKAYELAVQVYIAKDEQVKAIETGLDALQQLGVPLVEWDQAQALPSLPSPAELAQKPTMTDRVSLAALRMLITITPPVHHVKPALFPTVTLTMLDLCDRDGYAAPSAFAYGSYGLFLGALIGDPEAAHRSGQLSLAILERYPAPELRAKVNMLFAVFVSAYKESGQTTLPLLKQGIEVGLDSGDIEHASYSVMGYFTHLLLTGQPLETVEHEQKIYLELLHKYKQEHCIEYADIWLRSTQQWLLEDHDRSLAQSQTAQLQHFEATQNHQCLFAFHLAALITTYMFGDAAAAVDHAQQAVKSEKAAFGLLLEIAHNFYYSLALLSHWRTSDDQEPGTEPSDRDPALQQVAVNQAKMQIWARHAPINCEHKHALVEAERHRVLGQKAEAMDGYDRAISSAQANDYIQEEALAHELAARFYLDWGKQRLAQDDMIEAYYCYTRWGATTKVASLEQSYPQLLAPILQQRQTLLSSFETVVATKTTLHSSARTTSTGSTASLALDLAAVLKTSQALSSEIELEPLLAKLLQVITESAGADQCTLLLVQEGELMVAAVRQLQQAIAFPSIPLSASQNLPIALIDTVKRTLTATIINQAVQHPLLLADPYILRQQPQSVLCTPILHQGNLLGILYLENAVTVGAFTHDRVELLNLLCAQAAISLENARLYQQSRQALAKLSTSEARFQALAANLPGMIYQIHLVPDGTASAPYVSSGCTDLYELPPEVFLTGSKDFRAMEHPDDRPGITQAMTHSAHTLTPFEHEWRIITPSGTVKWVQAASRPQPQADGSIIWDGVQIDISDRKRGEADRQQADAQLRQQADANQLIASIAQTINQSVRLDQVLDGCLEQVRHFFQSDRVLICRFDANYNIVIELEALAQPELSLRGQTIEDPCFDRGWVERYHQGYVTACNDAQTDGLSPCYAALLGQLQVRASLAVGILQGDQIWGLMIIHHCHQPYEWQPSDIDLLKQLGLQIGIANQKAILYAQLEAELAERRRTEAALQISEQNLRAIFNNVSSGILVHDLNGMVQDANDAVLRLYQLEREHLPQISVLNDCSAPNNPFHLIPDWWARVLAGEPVNFEWQSKRFRDGTVFDTEVRLTKIVLDGEAMILGSVQDISERKRAEQQLQASQQLLELVLNTIPHKVFWKDCNLVYQGSNRAFAEVAGLTPTAIIGKSDYDLLCTTEEADWFRECDRRVMESNHPELGITETILQADGTTAWIETSKLPLHDTTGTVIGVLGIYQDITDRKQAEAELTQRTVELEQTLQELQRTHSQMVQSEKMSGLGQLVAGVAHEINNPVNFIYGNLTHANSYTNDLLRLLGLYQKHYPIPHSEIQIEVDAIDLDFLLEDLPKLLASMRVGAERIQKIVASLRNFSRMDEAEVKAVNLHDGIDSTLMILQHRLKATADKPGIEIIKEYANLPLVECYAGQLNQVFMNVLSNAIDALEDQMVCQRSFQPTLKIRTTLTEQQQVRMSFTDNGPGIPDEVKLKLFNPFFTTKPVGKGTGMGLSISHQIVTEKHGGTLRCVSAPGQGTEFMIEIPLQR